MADLLTLLLEMRKRCRMTVSCGGGSAWCRSIGILNIYRGPGLGGDSAASGSVVRANAVVLSAAGLYPCVGISFDGQWPFILHVLQLNSVYVRGCGLLLSAYDTKTAWTYGK